MHLGAEIRLKREDVSLKVELDGMRAQGIAMEQLATRAVQCVDTSQSPHIDLDNAPLDILTKTGASVIRATHSECCADEEILWPALLS